MPERRITPEGGIIPERRTKTHWVLTRDRQSIRTDKSVIVGGNLSVKGHISGSIDVSQITGLLGDGFTLQLPDVINNLAKVEIVGIAVKGPMVIITGPGYDIEVIERFRDDGSPDDVPGFAQPHPFIFEAGGSDADMLKAYFDQYSANSLVESKSLSLIIQQPNQTEFYRWNFLSFAPHSYTPSSDGRTRFRWQHQRPASADPRFPGFPVERGSEPPDAWWQDSFNQATDKKVEIAGVTTFYPEVVCDQNARTLAFTYEMREGKSIYTWVKEVARHGSQDLSLRKALSVIELRGDREVSRQNYYECFPIQYEQFAGFGHPEKLKERIVVSFCRSEPA